MPEKINKSDPVYSRILINKTLMASMYITLGVIYTILFIKITTMLFLGSHWVSIAISSSIFGLPLMLFPETESWDYRPWQKQSQKYEYHYMD